MSDEKKSPIGELEKTLYSKTIEPAPLVRSRLKPKMTYGKRAHQVSQATTTGENKQASNSFLTKLLLITFAFFIITVGVAGFVLWQGGNSVSGQNINFDIKGPVAVSAGDETTFQVLMSNSNTVQLQNVVLNVEFPAGTKMASTTGNTSINRISENIGTVDSGSLVNKSVKAIFFGNKGEVQEVRATIEYNIPGSQSLYTKNASISFSIDSPPVNLSIEVPDEITSGQEMALTINMTPQSEDSLEPMLITVLYPSGFSFSRSSREPTYGQNTWLIPSPQAGRTENIIIYGVVDGTSGAEKIFQVTAGAQDLVLEDVVELVFNQTSITTILASSFVDLGLTVNEKVGSKVIVASGDRVSVSLPYKNNLDTVLNDVEIKLNLDSNVDIAESISVSNGFYSSTNNQITWNKTTTEAFTSLAPNASGQVNFSFRVPDLSSEQVVNPTIALKADFVGIREGAGFSSREITADIETKVQVASAAAVTNQAFYSAGPLQNTGPLPPKVGEETTYTVAWTINNPSNNLRDTLVRTTLPVYVDWKNTYLPLSEAISFNATSREVVWQVGQLEAGAREKKVSFQVGLNPSLSQEGTSPNLTGEVRLSGFDTFTDTVLNNTARAVNIRTLTDSNFNNRDGVVTP